nr:ABC transporter substrate-binding protein [uncultured Dorea sp.]
MKQKRYRALCVLLSTLLLASGTLTGCGSGQASGVSKETQTEDSAKKSSSNKSTSNKEKAPEIEGLEYQKTMNLTYATEFNVFYYKGGYKLLDVKDDRQYLIVPEGKKAPKGLDGDIIVLKQPLDHIYLAATSAMALFDSIDGLDHIRMSGAQASDWYVEHAKEAMEAGDILFAGKYSEPDYEMLIKEDCDLAIESTMILHTPKVQEMIEDLDIPVFIDRSSYEGHPLGRTEWIKAYAAMLNKEDAADTFFEEQAEIIEELKDFKNTGKTVAYFFVSTDGTVVVRSSKDYIPKMIEIAGGKYIFKDLKNTESKSSSVNLSMEEFYSKAKDADYLIYNATIDNPIQSVQELTAKNELFADFKAVKNGNVWCTGKSLYQATDIVGNLITDIHLMLTDGDPSEMTFLYQVTE